MAHKKQGNLTLGTKLGYRDLDSLSTVAYSFPFELETADMLDADHEKIEVTSLESDGKEFTRGLAERKASVSFYVDYTNTAHLTAINDLFFSGKVDRDIAFLIPGGAMWAGQGFFLNPKTSQASPKDVAKMSCDITFNKLALVPAPQGN